MSRFRRFAHGMLSSYVLLVATALYSIGSVPLALHFLNNSQFGLWVVMGTLSTYLALIDLGMTSAGCRLFIDHKSNRDQSEYGGLIKSCLAISAVQGLLIVLIGFYLGPSLAGLLAIPAALSGEFIQLFNLQSGIIAISCMARIFMLLLLSHQRVYLVNYAGVIGLVVNFLSQWLFFYLGFGLLSLSLGALTAALCVIPIQFWNCISVGVFPSAGHWGKIRWRHFRELFSLGRDLFLVSLGMQIVMASQSIVIARFMGLDAAAMWGIGLRVFQLLTQALGRITDITEPVFAEMISLGEMSWLKDRYANLAMVTFSLAAWLAFSFAGGNSLFTSIWTNGKIYWPAEYDLLLGAWMILLCITGRHSKLIAVTKKIGFLRYIYFIEGAAFVLSSVFLIKRWGIPGMLCCSIICGVLFSGSYLVWRVSTYFDLPLRIVAFEWFKNMFLFILLFAPLLGFVWFCFSSLNDSTRLTINILFSCLVGGILFLRFGVPSKILGEILDHIPRPVAQFLCRYRPMDVNKF